MRLKADGAILDAGWCFLSVLVALEGGSSVFKEESMEKIDIPLDAETRDEYEDITETIRDSHFEVSHAVGEDQLKYLNGILEKHQDFADVYYIIILTKPDKECWNMKRVHYFVSKACPMRMLSTMCLRVDNVNESTEWLWAIPGDYPSIEGEKAKEWDPFIRKSFEEMKDEISDRMFNEVYSSTLKDSSDHDR